MHLLLREFRHAQHLSLRTLAAAMEIHNTTLMRWEVEPPEPLLTCVHGARALGVTLDELLVRWEDKPPEAFLALARGAKFLGVTLEQLVRHDCDHPQEVDS